METIDAAHIFGALAQETRLAILHLLIGAGPNGLAAGEIAQRLRLPASTISFHLAALERTGLVRSTKQSRLNIYTVQIAALRRLIAFLTETCCSGHPELCGDIANLMPASPAENVPIAPAFNVLFLCTRNSARSIMAEAILETLGKGRFRAYSAGSNPAPEPMPEVIAFLRKLGHDVSRLHSKSWDEFCGPNAPRMDFVIALCDMLHGQKCPDFAGAAVTAEWPLPDPAGFQGNASQRLLLFQELYAGLQRRLEIFTNLPFEALDRMALKARLDEIGGQSVALLHG